MSFLFRGTSRSRNLALFKNAARPSPRLASRFGHERCAWLSTAVGAPGEDAVERCTLLSSDAISSNLDSRSAARLAKMQLSPGIFAQISQQIETGEENAFYVVDTSAVEERYKLWHDYLPEVRPYYAVKCNPDAALLQSLARLGAGFDCASLAEINAVLSHGVEPSDIIYANPCKQPSHVRFATSRGVDTMTFDSIDELTKIHKINPSAKLVLRLYVDDTKAICRLGTKFGAMVHDVPAILSHAKDLNLNVVGVSFHVGSGCFSVSAYSDAVLRARKAFDIGASLGFQFDLLDIGGGFPGTEGGPISFQECAAELKASLGEHFSQSSGVRIISEPGRFFAASTHTLAVNVIGRKVAPTFDIPGTGPDASSSSAAATTLSSSVPNYMYFVNDGLYGSFNCLVYDHPTIQPVVVTDAASDESHLHTASIWGPTCDGMDCIMKEVKMPAMEIGQWICFPSMGAYTCAAGSDFNGFAPPQKIYFDGSEALSEDKPEQQFVH
ncbi:Ornithine decarboxylase 1 [Globisporangium polare]